MIDSTRAAIAAGMTAGYLLGRSKKAKFALALATFAAGRRARLSPRQILADAIRKVVDSPQCAELGEQLRGELLDTGKSAVTALVNREVASLTDLLAQRTRSLNGEPGEGGREKPDSAPEAGKDDGGRSKSGRDDGGEEERTGTDEAGAAQDEGAGEGGTTGEDEGAGEGGERAKRRPAPATGRPRGVSSDRPPPTSRAPGRRTPGEPLAPRRALLRRPERSRSTERASRAPRRGGT